jgi:hypothetical protein
MATIIVNTPPIVAVKQITNEDFHIHNPLIISINALCDTLTYQYMSHFGFSYTDRRLFWYDVPDITKMDATDLEDWLTVHVYDPKINCAKNKRSMEHVRLVDLIPLDLKSTKQYLEALQVLFSISPIKDYLQQNIIPVPADFPGQVYIRSAIVQKLGGNNNVPNEILGIIPMLGPLHISLNSREILVMKYWPFFDKLWKAVMGQRKKLAAKPKPWRINLILHITYSAWLLIKTKVIQKFQTLTLEIYANLFRGGFFDYYIESIFRIWCLFIRMRRKNYDKAPLIFLSDIIYWETISHPLLECMRNNLPFFNEYFVENFHSSLRRQTSHKILNHEGLRKDAFVVDALRKENNFSNSYVQKEQYPWKGKKLQNLIFLTGDFLLKFFSQLYNNQNKSYIIKNNTGKRRLKYPQYFFATLNMKVDVMLLPTGYNTEKPPSSEKFCDYDQCSILLDTESTRQVLICGHAYHSDCLKILNFVCLPCTHYFCDGIKKLSQSFIDRLTKDISDEEEEENRGGINTDEDGDIFEEEISENVLAQEKFFHSLSLF